MSSVKKYEYVITIANCGGISQAADKLKIAQPTLSKYIKKLELDLGVELFDRSTVPLKATLAGEAFIEVGLRMINLERQLQKQLEEIKENKGSTIRVGISPSRSPYMMPSIIESYKKSNPYGRVVIEERTTSELKNRLISGDLDLIISLEDSGTSSLERVELFEEKILIATNDTLLSSSLPTEILSFSPIISVGKGQAMWQALNSIIDALGAPTPQIECQSIESALSLVKRGIGTTLVPSYIASFGNAEQNKNLKFVELPTDKYPELNSICNRRVCLFYRREQFLTEAEKCFISCVKNAVK